MHPLIRRLKDRKLVQWSLAYLAAAWVLVQLSHLLGQQFAWPDALVRGITVVLAVGFLGALVVAWYHGEKGAQRVTPVELGMLAGILVLAGAAVAFVGPGPAGDGVGHTGAPVLGPLPVEEGTIAVLPFQNLSGDPEQEYFAAGITDDILTTLSRTAKLQVISRTSSMQYRGTDKPLRRIGAELGAAHLLEGSVRRHDGRVRITAQLIDARTDRHLWAETFDRELRDVFEIQMEVAERIAEALRVTLISGVAQGPTRLPTSDLAAYDLVLRSRDMPHDTREGNIAAIALLREAIRLDPAFAEAHAALGLRLARRIDLHSFPPDSAAAGIAAARRAIELDDRLPHGHLALGENLWYAGRYAEAAAAARRAIELDPSDAGAMEMLFWAEFYDGRREEALRWALRGYRLNPRLAGLPNAICVVFLDAGAHAEAERWCNRALELDPQDAWPHFNMVRLELLLRRFDDARLRAESMRRRDPASVPAMLAVAGVAAHTGQWSRAAEYYRQAYEQAPASNHYEPTRLLFAHALARVGDKAGARGVLVEARRDTEGLSPGGGRALWRLGTLHAIEGDHDRALQYLEQAYQAGADAADQVRHSPFFEELRQDPAFGQLVGRLDERQAELRRRLEAVVAEAGITAAR